MFKLLLSLLLTGSTWTPETTLEVQQIKSVEPSPDGSQALLLTAKPHLDGTDTTHRYQIHLPNDDYTFEATADAAPKWSCDGRFIAYRTESALVCLDVSSKTHHTLPVQNGPIISFAWAPNSHCIAYTTEAALHLVTVDGTDQTLLTNIHPVSSIAWSPDGRELIYTHSSTSGMEGLLLDSHLTLFDLSTHQTTPLDVPGSQSRPSYSPDGQWIAFIQSEVPAHYNTDRHVALYNRTTGEITSFLPLENLFLPRYSLIGWTPDSSQIICCETYKTQFRLYTAALEDKAWTPFSTINAEVPLLNSSGTHIGFISQSPSTPPEAFITPTAYFQPTQITHFNDHLPSVPPTTLIHWTAPDGLEIEGLLTLPSRGNPPYPLILSIHGGPMAFWNDDYIGLPHPHPTAVFADAGYAILRPNVRGSCGYGKAFRFANTDDWGGGDLTDALSGVDYLISEGIADPDKLGIVGWSYGGYLTAYAITQTDRFKTASVLAGILNIPSFAATNDIPHLIPDCVPTTRRSPIDYASQIETPLLIQHGTADVRVPYSQALEFTATLDDESYRFTSYENMTHCPISDAWRVMQENVDWLQETLPPCEN